MIGYRKMIKYERHNYDFNWNSLDNYRNFLVTFALYRLLL